MDEVWVGVCCRADGLIQHIALAGYRRGSIPSSAREELRLPERRALPFSLALVFLLAIASAAVHTKEVLELLWEVAIAIGMLSRRHREPRQMPLLAGK